MQCHRVDNIVIARRSFAAATEMGDCCAEKINGRRVFELCRGCESNSVSVVVEQAWLLED